MKLNFGTNMNLELIVQLNILISHNVVKSSITLSIQIPKLVLNGKIFLQLNATLNVKRNGTDLLLGSMIVLRDTLLITFTDSMTIGTTKH